MAIFGAIKVHCASWLQRNIVKVQPEICQMHCAFRLQRNIIKRMANQWSLEHWHGLDPQDSHSAASAAIKRA